MRWFMGVVGKVGSGVTAARIAGSWPVTTMLIG